MIGMILQSKAQMAPILPFFPLSHGVPGVDDRRVFSSIIFVIHNGLRWHEVLGPLERDGGVWPLPHPHNRCAHTFMSAFTIAVIVTFWI